LPAASVAEQVPLNSEQLRTAEQAVNYVEDRLKLMREHIHNRPPPPTDVVSSQVAIRWHNRLLLLNGMAIGAIQALQAFGVISVEQFQQAKIRLMNVTSARAAGYIAAFATKPTRLSPNYDLYEIKRVRISPSANNMFVYAIKLSGYHAFFREMHSEHKDIPALKWKRKES